MKKYTEEEQRANLEGACKALEENPKKALSVMRDNKGGRCCLCVMEDYARSVDPEVREGGESLPHSDLASFYGIKNSQRSKRSFSFMFNNGDSAASCNDGIHHPDINEHTHKEIAARIRKDFLA